MAYRIYLAGDLVFRRAALEIFDRLKALCAAHGLSGIAPFDGQAEIAGLPPGRQTGLKIVRADRELMDSCHGGLFCLDGFRGAADMDPGTAVEIGYMHAQAKPLAGYTADTRDYPARVRDMMQGDLRPRPPNTFGGSSGALEDPAGIMVHSEGFYQNAMTEGFIALSGGAVFADADVFAAADLALGRLAALLTDGPAPAD